MKILRFDDERIGILKDEGTVADVSDVISHREERGPQRVMEELIGNFTTLRPRIEELAAGQDGVALDTVKLLAPVPRPSRCLAAFVNYLDSPTRSKDTMPNEFFHKAPELVGPEGTVELPDVDRIAVFHAEAELAYVIGRHAKHVPEAKAMDYVFGYVPFFDISARGLVRRSQFLPKGQDTFAVCGPWITTADEIADPHELQVRSWVNDEPRQDYNTRHMAHDIPDQIAWLTRFIQLQPGDVIATGTYHEGLGPINVGDRLRIEITGLGSAGFNVGGTSPRKAPKWDAEARKAAQQLEPGLSITRVL